MASFFERCSTCGTMVTKGSPCPNCPPPADQPKRDTPGSPDL